MTKSTATKSPKWELIQKSRDMAYQNPKYLSLLVIIARALIEKVTGKYGENSVYPLALIVAPDIEVRRKHSVRLMYIYLLGLGLMSVCTGMLYFEDHPSIIKFVSAIIILTTFTAGLLHACLNIRKIPKFHKLERDAPSNVEAKERMIAEFVQVYEFIAIMEYEIGYDFVSKAESLKELQILARRTFRVLAESVAAKMPNDEDEGKRRELRFMIGTSITLGIFSPYPGTTESELSKELYTEAFRQDLVVQTA